MVQRTIVLAIVGAASAASAAPKPTVTIARPTVAASLDAKAVDAVAQRARAKVLVCYEKALAKDPGLAGTVVTTFSVGADGKLANVYASGLSPEVRACVKDTLTKLGYGRPKDGQDAAVAIVVACDNGSPPEAVARPEVDPEVDRPKGHNKTRTPTVSVGQPNAQGDLDKAIIRRYVKRNIQKIQYCYEKNLIDKPGLAGTAMIEFVIGVDGKVTSSKGSGLDKVDTCVADVILGIEFPKPQGGGSVKVNYPFAFRPAD